MPLLKYLRSRFEPLFLSDTAFVEQAFRQILNRGADPGGLEHYRKALAQGVPRTSVLIAIMHSEEFQRYLAPVSSSLPSLILQRSER